jgi:hypothetical protein
VISFLLERGANIFSKDQVENSNWLEVHHFFLLLPQSGRFPLDVASEWWKGSRGYIVMKKLMVLPSFPGSISPFCQTRSWLFFYHTYFNQNIDQETVRDREQSQNQERSSLKKILEISDLFRFITEFVLEE